MSKGNRNVIKKYTGRAAALPSPRKPKRCGFGISERELGY